MPAATVARLLSAHGAIGLALGGLIYLVCLTGTLCVFLDELRLWETTPAAAVAFAPADADRLLAQAVQLAGGPAQAGQIYLTAPQGPGQRLVITTGSLAWTPDATGRLVALHLPWTGFLAVLHETLTLPAPWGAMLVGLLGVGLLALLVSGILAHPRILRDAFLLRLGGTPRVRLADLHNRLGVWGLPFHLAVTLTGAAFGLSPLVLGMVATLGFHGDTEAAARALTGVAPAADPRPAKLPPLAGPVAQSLALHPGGHLLYLGIQAPGTRGAQLRVTVSAPGRLPRGDETLFDAEGRRTGGTAYASGAAGLQLYSGAAQVHFGAFGGPAVRLAYGLLGGALCWVCANGMSIHLRRRRDAGHPAPALERGWSACVCGAPIALACAAATGQAGTPSPALVFWIVLPALLASSQLPALAARPPQASARLYRLALAAILPGLAGLHWPEAGRSQAAMLVQGALVLTGCALAASVLRARGAD